MRPSICSTPLPLLSGCSNAATILRAFSTSSAARRERLVTWRDMAGMNDGLAVEAEIARLRRFFFQAVDIGNVVINAVDDIDAVRTSSSNRKRQKRQKTRAAARDLRPRFLGVIVCA